MIAMLSDRLSRAAWILLLVALGAPRLARAQDESEAYLREFPTRDRVLADMQGSNASETALRQWAALYQLQTMLEPVSGPKGREGRDPVTIRISNDYANAMRLIPEPEFDPAETQRLGEDSPRAKWLKQRTELGNSIPFRDQLLARWFSPQFRTYYLSLVKPPAAAPGAAVSAPAVAASPPPSHFTVYHRVQFAKPTGKDRQELSHIPIAILFTSKPFEIAREDLNDDGTPDIIVVSTKDCGSAGCMTFVFDNRGGSPALRMNWPMLPPLAVTNEKVGSYRALVPLDDHGEIVIDEKPGPRFGKQIVYATAVPVRRPAYTTPPKILIREACAGDPSCAENPAFFAIVTNFRLDLVNDTRVITATVRFGNKLDRTMLMGYVIGSGSIVDERGNRYSVLEPRDVSVIGEWSMPAMRLEGREQLSPEFMVYPGGLKDIRFKFALPSGHQDLGTQYTIDLTMRQIDEVAISEYQLGKEFPLRFSGFTDAGPPSAPSTSTPPEVKLAGAYMSKGGPSMLERLTFTSGSDVKIEDGIATRMGTYVIQGRQVTVTWGPGDAWVFTVDGNGCVVGDVKSIEATLCRQ